MKSHLPCKIGNIVPILHVSDMLDIPYRNVLITGINELQVTFIPHPFDVQPEVLPLIDFINYFWQVIELAHEDEYRAYLAWGTTEQKKRVEELYQWMRSKNVARIWDPKIFQKIEVQFHATEEWDERMLYDLAEYLGEYVCSDGTTVTAKIRINRLIDHENLSQIMSCG